MLERECFGKNVLSNLSSRKMCSNIEKCVFRRVSQWNTLFYMEKFMKKFLLSLSLIAVMLCGLCACSNNGTFFSKEVLQDNLVPDLPKISYNKAKQKYKKMYYYHTTEDEFNSYVAKVYEYLKSLDFEYLGTRGEVITTAFGGCPTYEFVLGNELSDFLYAENYYVFVWANEKYADSAYDLHSYWLEISYYPENISADNKYNLSLNLNFNIESYRLVDDK